MRTFHLLGSFVLVLTIMVGGIHTATAAVGPGPGFLTLYNETTRQHILVACVDGSAVEVFAVIDGELTEVGASLGTPCSTTAFEGFDIEFNIDPRVNPGAWVLHTDGYLGEGVRSAYACTDNGAAFAIMSNSGELHSFDRTGGCTTGTVPG